MFHTVRNSRFCTERTYLVSDAGLTVLSADGGRIDIPIHDIRSVRLKTTICGRRCLITTKNHRLVLTSRHYVSRARFEDRSESFSGFLDALQERLRPFAANVRVTAGAYRLSRVAAVMFVMLPLLYAAGLLAFSQTAAARPWTLLPALLIAPVTLLGALLPLMSTRRTWRRSEISDRRSEIR